MIGLRAMLLLPLGALGVLVLFWAAYTLAVGQSAYPASAVLLALLALLALVLGITATNTEVFVLRPLRRLLQAAQDLAQNPTGPQHGSSAAALKAAPGALRELAGGLDRLGERMLAYEAQLAQEKARRHALEQSVRELEDRYALTVERANDGVWEWNLDSGAVDFSPRWKGLLGRTNTRIEHIDEWRSLLHPEERSAVLLALENHVSGQSPHFDKEYRLRHGDGQYRWIHSRGTAIRHATGKAYRLVVMDNDIHERKTIEETLVQAAEGLSSVSGDDFYRALMENLSSILGTRDNLVCYCVGDPPTRAHTLAYYSRGQFTENFEYDLAGTSCGAVIDRGEIVYVPTGVCDTWPLEKEFDRDSYIGVPMFDSAGKIIGHFACMDGQAMRQNLPHLALFKIFSVRAAAELERMLLKQKIEASASVSKA